MSFISISKFNPNKTTANSDWEELYLKHKIKQEEELQKDIDSIFGQELKEEKPVEKNTKQVRKKVGPIYFGLN